MLGLHVVTKLDLTLQACEADGLLYGHRVRAVQDGVARLQPHKAILHNTIQCTQSDTFYTNWYTLHKTYGTHHRHWRCAVQDGVKQTKKSDFRLLLYQSPDHILQACPKHTEKHHQTWPNRGSPPDGWSCRNTRNKDLMAQLSNAAHDYFCTGPRFLCPPNEMAM